MEEQWPSTPYPYSYEEAQRNGEYDLQLYQESHSKDIACRDEIKAALAKNFDGYRLKKGTAKEVIEKFGYDRVNWVLANTIQKSDQDDPRIELKNREWAKQFFISRDIVCGDYDKRKEFVLYNSSVGLINLFTNQAKEEYQKLNLYEIGKCHGASDLDFEHRLMVLKATSLSEKYKSPDYQLFYCTSGFGCSPNSRGRKVFGEFLKDGERCQFQREDFIGELKPEFLPEWAKEKMEQYQSPSEQQDQQEGQNMNF